MDVTISFPVPLATTQNNFVVNNTSKVTSILNSIINEEKLYGTSISYPDLIRAFALMYYNMIQVIEVQFNASWNLLNWLTQDEINTINFLKNLEGYV
jgi:hypothetical protein